MYYIYLILNKVNGKTYIGQRSSKLKWNEDEYMGSGKLIKLAKEKYGIENLEKFLIQYCYSKEEANKAERFWIAEYRSRGKAEYNIADGGQGFNGRHSEEWTNKIVASRIANNKMYRSFAKCIETGEIKAFAEWERLGYRHIHEVADGYRRSTKGLHFVRYEDSYGRV